MFGFSLSLLAGRLVVPDRADEVFGDPMGLIGFVITFAALVGFWFINHRMFRDYFTPRRLDVLLVFVELAGVALLPYALSVAMRFRFAQPQPLMLYDLVFIAVLGSNAVIGRRGFGQHWRAWNEAKRRDAWRRVLINAVLTVLFVLAIPFAGAYPHVGWVPYLFIFPVSFGFRRFYAGLPAFAREAPGATAFASEI